MVISDVFKFRREYNAMKPMITAIINKQALPIHDNNNASTVQTNGNGSNVSPSSTSVAASSPISVV
jgi:hypothetical protein